VNSQIINNRYSNQEIEEDVDKEIDEGNGNQNLANFKTPTTQRP